MHQLCRSAPLPLLRCRPVIARPRCTPLQSTVSRHMSGLTGVYLQPLPDDEVKIMQWMKKQEIDARKKHMLTISEKVWRNHTDMEFDKITLPQCKQLLSEYLANEPTTWQVKQLYTNTLRQYAAYRLHEEEQQRKQKVEVMIDEIYDEINTEVRKTRGTIELSKNDLVFRLEDKLGELPSGDEVDAIWQDRFRLPLVQWKGGD